MKMFLLFILLLFIVSDSFSINNEVFSLSKEETYSIIIDKKYLSASRVDLDETKPIASLAISGYVKLNETESLIRVVLITEENEYLIFEAYPLINDEKEFNITKICEETSILDFEKPIELLIFVTNAEFHLDKIHFSDVDLNQNEKSNLFNYRIERKTSIEKHKVSNINYNNQKKNKTWVAGITELSQLPFEQKKNLFGGNYDFVTGGLEYYIDGIFSFEDFKPKNETNKHLFTESTYIHEFDWRNRHGKNWITSIKNQSSCGSCTAFATIAATEAIVNIYHNHLLDLDLSEQEVWVCNSFGGSCAYGAHNYQMLNYVRDVGVSEESCFPYAAQDRSILPCLNKCTNPSLSVSISSYSNIGNNELSLMHGLINSGPLVSGFCNAGCCHAMALIGYKQLQEGDVIRYVINDHGIDSIIGQGNPLIGETCWIFKNSYGESWNGGITGGYFYAFFQDPNQISSSYTINNPTITIPHEIACADNDNDGYYYWGIGPKPSTCPTCAPDEPDGDDSNPNLGPMDEYGNLTVLSQAFQHPETMVTSIENWNSTIYTCGNVIVTGSGNLTISGASIYLDVNSTFEVQLGGELYISEGIIN